MILQLKQVPGFWLPLKIVLIKKLKIYVSKKIQSNILFNHKNVGLCKTKI